MNKMLQKTSHSISFFLFLHCLFVNCASRLSFIPFSFVSGTGEKKRSLGRDYHPLCLKCQKCNRQLTPGQHAEVF